MEQVSIPEIQERQMKLYFLAALMVAGLTFLATPVFSQDRVHPAFTGLSEQQVQKEFADYEAKGKKCAQEEARGRKCVPVSFSVEQPFNVPVQGTRGVELLTFRVGISVPRSQVRRLGYQFGILGRERTPADREDLLKRLITRMKDEPQEILVVVKLVSRSDWSTSLPNLSFALVNENTAKIWSPSQPNFDCPERDIICQVAMEESGTSVTFPLFLSPDKIPFVTDKMKTLKLVVTLDSQEEQMEFDLNRML